jgi:hypothetical protein
MINTNKIHIYIDIDHMKTAETISQGCTLSSSPVKSVFFYTPTLTYDHLFLSCSAVY